MQSHADVVKKGYLKYKASKIKGRNAFSTQGPRTTTKEMFVVFRAPSGSEKCLDFYQSDRKYAEAGQPKWSTDLSSATKVNVQGDNRVCFSLELGEGGSCLLEAKTLESAEEWISCFNAVLFTKGAHGEGNLLYEVDLHQSEHLQYRGPVFLELAEGYLIVWTLNTQEEVVRWKLSHIRSFKAKKNVLTIYTGSRSTTGVGEFHFNSPLSVQITHAIETLVARLKSRKTASQSSVVSTSTSRLPQVPAVTRPLPRAPRGPVSNEMPGLVEHSEGRQLRPSITDNIPSHNPQEFYEDIDRHKPHEFYEDIDRSLPHQTSQPGTQANGRVPRLAPHTSPPNKKRGGGYEDIPDGPIDQPEPPVVSKKATPSIRYHKKEQPAQLPTGAVYAQVDKSAKRRSRRHASPDNSNDRSPPPPAGESYGQLHHFDSSPSQPPFQNEEYGKLAHPYRHQSHSPPRDEEYGRLEHNSITSGAACGYQPEEYGKLVRPGDPNPPSFSEYGKLEGGGSPVAEEYGKLGKFDPYGTLVGEDLEKTVKNSGKAIKVRPSGYEMMDEIEESPSDGVYSVVDDEPRGAVKKEHAAPPPGYENTVLKVTPAEKASYNRLSTHDPDRSPPTTLPVPPERKPKHHYINLNDDGTVKAPKVTPRKNKSNGLLSPTEPTGRELTKSHSLEEGMDDHSPPTPPQRGVTVHGSNRRHFPQTKKPPTAPKPKPLAKPKI